MSEHPALIATDGLTRDFEDHGWFGRRETVRAVNHVDLHIAKEETLALVGESGSGKTTLGRLLMRLIEPTSGTIKFDGVTLQSLSAGAMRQMRRRMQIVFQDPYGSLNPRMRIATTVAEPLEVHGLARGAQARERAGELLAEVGLASELASRYPHELSGGQRQRVGIARALALRPEFLVLDEPVAALDVSVQAQVLHLLTELRARHGLTYLFIAHDLAVVRHLAHRIAVMYFGRLIETAPVAELFKTPKHPYTQALLAAIPHPDPTRPRPRVALRGEAGRMRAALPGCPFHARCMHPAKDERCLGEQPSLRQVGVEHLAACHHADLSSSPTPDTTPGDPAS